jgi:hypothetical protein
MVKFQWYLGCGLACCCTGSYSCDYTHVISGNAGDEIARQITAAIEDDELNTVVLSEDISVYINATTDIIFGDGFESN